MTPPLAPTEFPPTNPFSSRFIRPGARPFIFPAGQSLPLLLDTLRKHAWRGEIVGRHGSGKSTLLHSLQASLLEAGLEPTCFVLRADGKVPPALRRFQWPTAASILVIDGFEQLSWPLRRKLIQASRREPSRREPSRREPSRGEQRGLITTSHRGLGLPRVFTTQPTLEIAQRVVDQMQAAGAHIEPSDVARCFHRHEGDIRETLFELYDVHQSRTHAPQAVLTT